MSQWTDEELGSLLAETFTSREDLADQSVADAIAASAARSHRRGRLQPYLIAAACVVVLVGASVMALRLHSTNQPTTSHTYAANRAAAARESARVIELVPLPPSAVRLPGRPAAWLKAYGSVAIEPSDSSLTRTAWWSAPVSGNQLRRYILAHHPAGFSPVHHVSHQPDGIYDAGFSQQRSPEPNAYRPLDLEVQWVQSDGRAWIRADTFTAARMVRTPGTFLRGAVTSVDIKQVVGSSAHGRGGPLPALQLTLPADRQAIAKLVMSINGLPASTRPSDLPLCPGMVPTPSLTVLFRTPTETFRAYVGDIMCGGQLHLARAGKAVEPTLEPGDFVRAVHQVRRWVKSHH